MKKQRLSFREWMLKIIGFLFSHILIIRFKIIFRLKGIPAGKIRINRSGWINTFPWSEHGDEPGLTTEYGIFDKLHWHGFYENSFKVNWNERTGNLCFWMLQLEHNKVQEIDIFETMVSGRRNKKGLYFSIYNNEESNYYFNEKDKLIARRYQIRMRGDRIMRYLQENIIDYKVFWGRNKVVWYVAGIPVAISYILIPTQKMWLIISSEY